jgi:hypothetical protein
MRRIDRAMADMLFESRAVSLRFMFADATRAEVLYRGARPTARVPLDGREPAGQPGLLLHLELTHR